MTAFQAPWTEQPKPSDYCPRCGSISGLLADNDRLRRVNAELTRALNAYDALVKRTQDRLSVYLEPDGPNDPDEAISDILSWLDGSQWREARDLRRAAIAAAETAEPTVTPEDHPYYADATASELDMLVDHGKTAAIRVAARAERDRRACHGR